MYEGGIKPSCFQVFMNNNDFSCYVESRVFNDRRTYMSQDFFPCQLASSEVANFFYLETASPRCHGAPVE